MDTTRGLNMHANVSYSSIPNFKRIDHHRTLALSPLILLDTDDQSAGDLFQTPTKRQRVAAESENVIANSTTQEDLPQSSTR